MGGRGRGVGCLTGNMGKDKIGNKMRGNTTKKSLLWKGTGKNRESETSKLRK